MPKIAYLGFYDGREYIQIFSKSSAQDFRKNVEKPFWLENTLNALFSQLFWDSVLKFFKEKKPFQSEC